jgi:hypothetical protein
MTAPPVDFSKIPQNPLYEPSDEFIERFVKLSREDQVDEVKKEVKSGTPERAAAFLSVLLEKLKGGFE